MSEQASWIDRKPFVVSAEQANAFKRLKKPFNCKLCGHDFKAGDTARWIYANGTSGITTGNFFVCGGCDEADADLMTRAQQEFRLAVSLAKKWGIYGPDWQ